MFNCHYQEECFLISLYSASTLMLANKTAGGGGNDNREARMSAAITVQGSGSSADTTEWVFLSYPHQDLNVESELNSVHQQLFHQHNTAAKREEITRGLQSNPQRSSKWQRVKVLWLDRSCKCRTITKKGEARERKKGEAFALAWISQIIIHTSQLPQYVYYTHFPLPLFLSFFPSLSSNLESKLLTIQSLWQRQNIPLYGPCTPIATYKGITAPISASPKASGSSVET